LDKTKIQQDIINLYDAFTHGAIDRRAFMAQLTRIAGGAAAASALLPLLVNDYASAAPLVGEDDERLDLFETVFETGIGDEGAVNAYAAKPKDRSIAPAVIVIHENRGLNPHIKDVARRIALEGFHAFAVDMLSPFGGTPADEDEARTLIGKLDADTTVAKLAAIADQLEMVKTHQRKVGAVGFCWGGGMVGRLAASAPGLDAGVVYYGRQPSAEETAAIKARMMLHYAGLDERINAGIADFESALDAAGVDYQRFIYEGAQHAFNNDTNAARYDKGAADAAWGRTIAFFKETLNPA
jgi:carboxymethylenebutenolidase